MATIPYDSMESWWTIRCKLRFAKSITERAKVHNRNRKVFMLIDLEPSKEVSGGVGCEWKWFRPMIEPNGDMRKKLNMRLFPNFGIHATTQEISLKGQVRLIFHKSTMFVHSLACSQSSCWLMQWGWSRNCFLLIPVFTQIYVCTWNMEKASKTKQKYEDFPKMFRALYSVPFLPEAFS